MLRLLAADHNKPKLAATSAPGPCRTQDAIRELTADHASVKLAIGRATRKLLAVDDLITADTTPAQVESVAKHVIALAEHDGGRRAKIGRDSGYRVRSSTHIALGTINRRCNSGKINAKLKSSVAYSNGQLKLRDDGTTAGCRAPARRRVRPGPRGGPACRGQAAGRWRRDLDQQHPTCRSDFSAP